MVVFEVPVNGCNPVTIVLGRRGTYNTQEVTFDLSYLVENYGAGTVALMVKRSQDTSAYPAVVSQEDNILTWIVSDVDTYYPGSGECQLMWYVDEGLAKTIIYPMVVMRDILATAEEPPDGYENWIEHLTELGAETQQNAQNAAQSASDASTAKDDAVTAKEAAENAQQAAETAVTHYPKIENNYWMVWDVDSQSYVSTGIQAEGEDGYSPEVTITTITGGHRVTITDKDHPQGQSFDVMDGQGGGGSGGTSDYSDLNNKPQINGHTLTGNQTAEQLDLATPSDIPTDAGDIGYDSTATYQNGTAGAALSELNRQLNDETTGLDSKAPVILETVSGSIASFDDGADNMPVKKLVVNIEPQQSGTGDPSPDNIRPISGHTGAEIEQTGVNIWDEEWDRGYVDGSNGGAFMAYPAYVRSKHKFRIDGGKTYYFACSRSGTLGNTGISYYDANGDFISSDVIPVNSAFTAPAKAKMMAFFVPSSWYTGDYADDISINYPATDTAYHPYTGNQISVTFPETIYGGSVIISENGNVNVSNTAESYDLSTLSWTLFGACDGGNRFYANPDMSRLSDMYVGDRVKCGFLKTANPNSINAQSPIGLCGVYVAGTNRFIIITYAADSVSDLVAKLGAYQVNERTLVVPFVTPIDYTLEAVEPVTTLYGQNNIWSNTGDTEVTYPEDTKLYIDNKLSDLDDDKQDAPSTAGTAGQVLGLDSNLNPVWVDQTGGGGGGMNIVNLSGTQITQVGADNVFYVCGELTELTFTAPAVGITMIRFTSGTTPTVLTVNGVTSWMFDNDPTAESLEANKTYDINVLNGVGVVGWA